VRFSVCYLFFWAAVSALWAFLPSRLSSVYCILLFYMLLILSVSTNKIYKLYRFPYIIAYFPKVKEVTWQWPRPFQGQFVVRRLGFAMINMHTKSSLSRSRDISGNWKFIMDHVTSPRKFQGRIIICRLGLALFNARTKFEVSAITCNEDMKGKAKCKISRFEPPFGGRSGNAQGSSMAR